MSREELGEATIAPSVVGTIIDGKFQIQELLGCGGMGNVYRAMHLQLGREVAVKILHPALLHDKRARSRFLQEARAINNLNHPNVVQILACGQADECIYIAMDLLTGESLAQKLKRDGVMTAEQSVSLLSAAAAGIGHAHTAGIIHRDIKPSNIMLCKESDGRTIARVVDFGVAKILPTNDEQIQELTTTGGPVGTPYYMSPEQCAGTQLDERSDIYSLGCVLYEMVSGAPPVSGETALAAMFAHLHTEVPPLPESVPGWLRSVILRCLEKDRRDRFLSTDDLIYALQMQEEVSQRRTRSNSARRVRKVFASCAVAIIGLVLVGAALFLLAKSATRFHEPGSAVSRVEEHKKFQTEIKELTALSDKYRAQQNYPNSAKTLELIRQKMRALSPSANIEDFKACGESLSTLSEVYIGIGEFEKALDVCHDWERTIAAQQSTANGAYHARAILGIARAEQFLGRPAEAVINFKRAVAIAENCDNGTPTMKERVQIACVFLFSGIGEGQLGDAKHSRMHLERAKVLFKSVPGIQSDFIADTGVALGQTLRSEGKIDQAVQVNQETLAIYEGKALESPTAYSGRVSQVNKTLGDIYLNEKRDPKKAIAYYLAGQTAARHAIKKESKLYLTANEIGIGAVRREEGRFDESHGILNGVLSKRCSLELKAEAWQQSGLTYLAEEKIEQALNCYAEEFSARKLLRDLPSNLCVVAVRNADLCSRLGKRREQQEYLDIAAEYAAKAGSTFPWAVEQARLR